MLAQHPGRQPDERVAVVVRPGLPDDPKVHSGRSGQDGLPQVGYRERRATHHLVARGLRDAVDEVVVCVVAPGTEVLRKSNVTCPAICCWPNPLAC